MKITGDMLRAATACKTQIKKFEAIWPEGAEVTRENYDRAVEEGFDVDLDFAAKHFLSASALAEYEKACDLAWAEYEKACDSAWAEYVKVCASARDEYEKVRGPAWAEYEKACVDAFFNVVEGRIA